MNGVSTVQHIIWDQFKCSSISFNTSQFSSANTTAGVKNQLTSLKITTDGSTAISSATDFIIVTGTSNNAHVYGWSDSGNGVIDNGELFGLATLTGVDNDNIGHQISLWSNIKLLNNRAFN